MEKLIKIGIAGVAFLVLAGCASGYKTFYSPADGVTSERVAARRVSPPSGSPTLERSPPGNPDAVLEAYAKRGYMMIGHSMFNSGKNESEAAAIEQGKAVGADIVLVLNPQYTGSVSTSVPLTMPTSTTSYTTGSATAYGSRGPVTAYGNATTTTYGSTTTYMPMTVHRSDFGAVYFVKVRSIFGAVVRDLNDAERQELGTNKGVVVLTIVDDAPAFHADILPGDIISVINDVAVPNAKGFTDIIGEQKGKEAAVTVIRRGQRLNKMVKLSN